MVARDFCTRLGLPCVYSRAGRACNNCQDLKRRCSAFTPKSDSSRRNRESQNRPSPSGSRISRAERSPSAILVSSRTKSPSAHGEDLMTPLPNRANCSSAKDYVRQAQAWVRKHGVNKRLKRPQEPASTSAAGPSSAARPSPTTGSKRPSADSLD
ncbi:hypothetical protein PTTG_10492 [Puccinia triticina 1-1 BBBD Race 1]|uniref:Zn(2)-C6 fungal-type domain-containing protein n=1 Tax=Puccinia triticina (isolate 1-1 / race 1 (BBBD)) TaxID=630390 RepID=A0A0C4FB98_PUCT1|nr:hypothetical protein PTTG_10492 [Puccinia triticina 1-1 BBBD Race 1]